MRKILLLCVIILLVVQPVVFASQAKSMEVKAKDLFTRFTDIVYYIFIIKAGVDIVQKLLSGDMGSAKDLLFKYGSLWAVLLLLPMFLDLIRDILR